MSDPDCYRHVELRPALDTRVLEKTEIVTLVCVFLTKVRDITAHEDRRPALNRNIDILSLNSTDKLFLYKVTVQPSLMLKLFPILGHMS